MYTSTSRVLTSAGRSPPDDVLQQVVAWAADADNLDMALQALALLQQVRDCMPQNSIVAAAPLEQVRALRGWAMAAPA